MSKRPIFIDRQGAEWAYKLGHFGHDSPFDPVTPHFHFWWRGRIGLKFEYLPGGNCV